MIAYFDTSALLKLLLDDEPGTRAALTIWRTVDGVITSRLTYPEGRASLAAARRSRRLSPARFADARTSLDFIMAQIETIELAPPVASLAGDLADAHALKGADAVHLASALGATTQGGTLFVTWDRRLGEAGVSAGLAVAPA